MGLAGCPIQLAVLPCCNELRMPAVAMTVYAGVFAAAALVFPLFEVRLACFVFRVQLRVDHISPIVFAGGFPPRKGDASHHFPALRLRHWCKLGTWNPIYPRYVR